MVTLEKYYKILMFLMTIGTDRSTLEVSRKWKKVLEDCLVEYWEFMGSRAGIRTSLLF